MLDTRLISYGVVPVPWTVSWSAEETIFLAKCRWAGGLALWQPEVRGEGRPRFGKPHSIRHLLAWTDRDAAWLEAAADA